MTTVAARLRTVASRLALLPLTPLADDRTRQAGPGKPTIRSRSNHLLDEARRISPAAKILVTDWPEPGPVFLAADGRRLDRHGAGRIVRKVARRAGIGKAVTPHTLRHAFITAALDAGVPLRDVQEAASHADPRTTIRYDRARGSLDRHATYIVAAYVAGAAR